MKALAIMKESIFHLIFLLALLTVSYSARDPDAFSMSSHLQNVFSEQTNDIDTFWSFVSNNLLPFAFNTKWYNEEEVELDGFTDDKTLYIVGMPRLRQLRIKAGVCEEKYAKDLNSTCNGVYSMFNEDKDFFLPGWVKTPNLKISACPIPWRHQTAFKLDGLPYWGGRAVYSGGGYTADLGYHMDQATSVISDLQTYGWVDKYTRAVFVELNVFNGAANLFSSVTYLVEFYGTGASTTFVKVDTFRLYQHVGPLSGFVAFCEFLAVLIVLIVFFKTCKKIYKQRKAFFKNAWNILDVVQIVLCFTSVGLYFVRALNTLWTINKVQENPFIFTSFQYASKWDEMSTYVIAFVVFIATLKFLQLLGFNRHIAVLGHTISRAADGLLPLGMEAFFVFLAFNIFAYVVFGSMIEGFSSFIVTLETTLAMTLGKAYFVELTLAEPILGPLFFTLFAMTMMFFLMNMFMAVIMDTYAEVNEEIEANSEEYEMAGFLLSYLKSTFGIYSEFEAGDEVWRRSQETEESPPEKIMSVKENCQLLKEQRKLLHKRIKSLRKLENDVGKSELHFAEVWTSHCQSGKLTADTDQLMLLTLYLCNQPRDSLHNIKLAIESEA